MNQIKFSVELDDKFRKIPVTPCPYKKNNYVGSIACVHQCKWFKSVNERGSTVNCSYEGNDGD